MFIFFFNLPHEGCLWYDVVLVLMKSVSYFVWQKRKLSDKPVEAGEDYTKFNSADFVRKVSVRRAVCLNSNLKWSFYVSLILPLILGSSVIVSSLALALFKPWLGQSGSPSRNMPSFSLEWNLRRTMNSVPPLLSSYDGFPLLSSSRPRRWLLLRKAWLKWTKLAWSLCHPFSAPRSKQKSNEFCTVSGFLIKKRKSSWRDFYSKRFEWEGRRLVFCIFWVLACWYIARSI